MSLWFLFALMTAAASFAVLWPLGHRTRKQRDGRESAVYRDQLAEIDRDIASGLIGASEGAAARVEISRRLLAAADTEEAEAHRSSLSIRRVVAVVALVGLPALAASIYLHTGSPDLPDRPLASRNPMPGTGESLDHLVAQVQTHLDKNPTDGRGWSVLAPVLVRLGRFDDATLAYRNAIKFAGDTAQRRAGLGEALVAAANGVVTAEAKDEFERAMELDPDEAKASYFLGLAAEQDGRPKDAAKIWQALLAKAPQDAPWRHVVETGLQRIGAPAKPPAAASDGEDGRNGSAGTPPAVAPRLSEDAVSAVQGMNEADRSAMVRGMVDRLAARLRENGGDVEGWLRLVRAYMVLNEPERSRAARDEARRALGPDEAGLRKLNEGLKALGIDG